ncbi:MAG: hypothetical protein IKF61_00655, partial [Firmicutes bacterium]|nr:hypothetical protein [Bacillota bacterium]
MKEIPQIRLYNSYTRKKDLLTTHEPGKLGMYTCGPTVYHYAHIGNLRSYIMEDVLEKFFRYAGYDVKRVMNVTDVGHLTSDADEGEDKIAKKARLEQVEPMEIAQAVASQGSDMVHYWMHNNRSTINGQKMGKSLGNFITLDEFFTGH